MSCPFQDICWRYSYTRRIRDIPYVVAPNRLEMFFGGYANETMMPKKGIYCDNMPVVVNGVIKNECPYPDINSCHEYKKESTKRERLQWRDREKYTNAMARKCINPLLKKMVAQRYKYTCVYCGRSQNQVFNGKKIKGVIDHIIPLALGGSNEQENLCFACSQCNHDKGVELWEFKCRYNYYKEI